MRSVLAENVRKLMAKHYASSNNRPLALSKDARVSLSTVQRILAQKTGATIDNIEAIAAAMGVSAYQLMVPNLNAENPQVIKEATKTEELLYARWRRDRLRAVS